MNPKTGIDSTGHWTPAQYAIDNGWDFECVKATAILGVASDDQEDLTREQAIELQEWCKSRVEEAK